MAGWRAQEGPQREAIQKAWVPELLYGGAAGAGKTAFLLGDFGQDVPTEHGPYWHGILFRQTYAQLEEVIKQSLEIYPQWLPDCKYHASEKTWKFPNGATLKLRYAEHENDWQEYQGHQYTWIAYDELTTWGKPTIYQRMKSRLRSAYPIPYKRIRATANPGGPGHNWVRRYFAIDTHPEGRHLIIPDDCSGLARMYLPGKVRDNKILLAADPGYIARLKGLGSPELVRAWLEGDWGVIQGSYFPEFSYADHVIAPFEVPEDWTRIRAMDWGSAAPSAVLWAAVSDGSPVGPEERVYPKGALVVYREWYTAEELPDGRRVGLKLTAEETGRGISERESEHVQDAVIDPAAFARNGGPSIVERMYDAAKISFRRGDNKRIPGWDAVRDRLKGNEDGEPMLYVFSTCRDLIRTLPALQHDQTKAEDVDTDGEDHAPDALRYLCMSRPWVRPAPKAEQRRYPLDLTFNELVRRSRKKRLAAE